MPGRAASRRVVSVVSGLTRPRPWMGLNAIHRLAPLLDRVDEFVERRPIIDGCEYREALQAVRVDGGVASNVVPDEVRLVLNHRFAPDRTPEQAFGALCDLLAPGNRPPARRSHRAGRLLASGGAQPRPSAARDARRAPVGRARWAKLGWTDVSFFAARGVPAVNYGPGDPSARPHRRRVGWQRRAPARARHPPSRTLLAQRRRSTVTTLP